MTILEMFIISIVVWLVFKILNFSATKILSVDYIEAINKNTRLLDWVFIVIGFSGSLPAVYVVYGIILPSFQDVPEFLLYYWLSIFHISCIWLYGGIVEDLKKRSSTFNPFIGFVRSCGWSFFCIAFCFTAGFVVVPLLVIKCCYDGLSMLDVKVGLKSNKSPQATKMASRRAVQRRKLKSSSGSRKG